jgi:beta-glucanase (GH16 family)
VKIVAFPFALLVATVAHAQNLTFDCEFGSGTSCGAPAASTNTSTDAQVSMGSKLNTNSSFNQTYGYFETEATLPTAKGTTSVISLLPSGATGEQINLIKGDGSQATVGVVSGQGESSETAVNVQPGPHIFAVDWEQKQHHLVHR